LNARVVIAEILRARGNRGEVLAVSQTDVPGRLETLKSANVRLANGADIQVAVELSWKHGDYWVLKFEGVDSIGDTERFRGADIWIPLIDRGQLPSGEYFRSDLLGCTVRESNGRDVGRVVGFQQHGGPLLLEIDMNGREILVPFVPDICQSVDLEAKTIGAALPEGLLDL
jgi:16S rRNA processing protein RimM